MKVRGMIIGIILLSAVVLSIPFHGCGGKATGADGTVIAEFEWDGKHQITLEEMQQEISELPEFKQRQYQHKEGLEEYMSLMAESRLILCLAKDQKLDEDPEILKKVHNYYHELLVDKITKAEVDEKLRMTEEDYRLYYEAHKDDYVEPDKARLTCITLTKEDRAKEIFQRIQDGEDIAELAKELSDKGELVGPGSNPTTPGDTDYFTRTTYSGEEIKAFGEAAFRLEIGQLHEEILTIETRGQKYHMIFRKEDYQPERQKTLDEKAVRGAVERAVKHEKREELMTDWLIRIHERAKVETYSDRIPEPPVNMEGAEAEPALETPAEVNESQAEPDATDDSEQ
ncbi:MAG: peptidyl-prolyl cis-trans isomerase [Candidatus Poribacteria bacterium]|nr:peptidyl-prolyl cis-trans isomerase [Candidatus Poribacteria bacterium]